MRAKQDAAAGLKRNWIASTALHAKRRHACHSADQFLRRKRLLHVVIKARRKGQLALQRTAVRGQGNRGYPRRLVVAGTNAASERVSVLVRHGDVTDEHIEGLFRQLIEGFSSAARRDH